MINFIFSNEFFDALPFHRLRRGSSGWEEIYVSLSGGELEETTKPLSNSELANWTSGLEEKFEEGQEIEARPGFENLFKNWGSIFNRGYILSFDYGYPRSELYHPIRMKGTWQCFHHHKINQNALTHIGEQDITAHVDFTHLSLAGQSAGFMPRLLCSQGLFLAHAGQKILESLVGGPAGLKNRSAIQQLIHPDAMGERFQVLLQTRDADLPAGFETIPNRLR